jgi:site-specific DNA recombinase
MTNENLLESNLTNMLSLGLSELNLEDIQMSEIKTVAAYIRISTQEQAAGHGLDYQEKEVKDYCKAKGLKLLEVYSDIESGTRKKRPGMNQLLADLPQYDAVVVYHTDRISRNLEHALYFIGKITRAGRTIVSTSQKKLDLDDPTGRLTFSILGAVSEYELSLITKRLSLGRSMVKLKAEASGSNLNHGKRPGFQEKKNWQINPDGTITKTLEVDPEAVKIVQLIKRHRRSGKSYREIVTYLNREAIPNKSGKPWNQVTVMKLAKMVV